MNRKLYIHFVIFSLIIGATTSTVQGYEYSFEVFTNNGDYADSSALNIYVEVVEVEGLASFTFYNESDISSSVAGIYFDSGDLFTTATINNGPGTSFSQPASPLDLPSGNNLLPPFMTSNDLSFGSNPPPSTNGINPDSDEWVEITFAMTEDTTFENVIADLDSNFLRIGLHVISFPDGSSEAATTSTPEPITLGLLGLGILMIPRRRG